jgi:3-oxoacyl-[acyl-carrier protein] reductase
VRPRTAVVTGASGDLGQAVVDHLLAGGTRVLGHYHTRPPEPTGDEFTAVQADLTTDEGARRVVAAVPANWAGIDLLVNCLGGARPVTLTGLDTATWLDCLASNVTAPFLILREAVPGLAAVRGCVINFTSVAAMTGGAFGPHYAAAKAAVIGLTRSAARELGPLGIRVNTIAPGPVISRMTDALAPEALAGVLAGTALGRVTEPAEVAQVVTWLAAATAVTGQTVVVDGGRCFV